MAEPIVIQQALEVTAGKLDEISKAQFHAYAELQIAEEVWEECWDQVAEDLKDQMAQEDRKGDPAEHVIKSTARRLHRDEYRRYRRAKREVEKLERIAQNRRVEVSGYQSLLKTLDAEAAAQGYVGQREPTPHADFQRRRQAA